MIEVMLIFMGLLLLVHLGYWVLAFQRWVRQRREAWGPYSKRGDL